MNQNESPDEVQIGRILHFVLYFNGRPQCRPAIVVEDWPGIGQSGYCNLVVFPDGQNDHEYGMDQNSQPILSRWETSVMPNHAVKAVRSWHWPRECGGLGIPMPPFYENGKDVLHHNHAVEVIDPYNCLACARQAAASA